MAKDTEDIRIESSPLDRLEKDVRSTRRDLVLLAVLTIACLIPFINKPFNIDDPVFIWTAKHIEKHPFDPFGFQVNWFGTNCGMYVVMRNPPLGSYYIYLAAQFVGWGEAGLHIAFLIPAVAIVLGTYRLACLLGVNPILSAFAVLFTPAFMVSCTTVMCDSLVVAFLVWGAVYWVEGIELRRRGRIAISGLLFAGAVLTKLNSVFAAPAFMAYAFARRRPIREWIVGLIIPGVVLAAYLLWLDVMYGAEGLMGGASRPSEGRSLIGDTLVGLSFTGGCVGSAMFLLPLICRFRWTVLAVGAGIFGAIAAWKLGWTKTVYSVFAGNVWLLVIEMGLMVAAGVGLLVVVTGDLVRRRDAISLLLALWFLVVFASATYVIWSVAGRYVFPLVPAAAIVLSRRITSLYSWPGVKWRVVTAMTLAAILSLSVAWADFKLALTSRQAASVTFDAARKVSRRVWLMSHSGLQYYAELLGAQRVDLCIPDIEPGDAIIWAQNVNNYPRLSSDLAEEVKVILLPSSGWIASVDVRVRAGFHSSVFGPVPFYIGRIPYEQYKIYRSKVRL